MNIIKIIKKLPKYFFDANQRFRINNYLGMYNTIADDIFLKRLFKVHMGSDLDLINPKTYNEKLQWLKLYDRKSVYSIMVDKYKVREYIASKIGEEYLIPLLGVWDTPEEIDFQKLPNQFVLKTNHDSGGVCICKDKSSFDIIKAKKKLSKSLKTDYYLKFREWPYKNIERKVIAEKYMVDESGTELKDYKFFCFNGEPKFLFVATDRPFDTRFDFFDTEFKHLPFKQGHPLASKVIKKPQGFDKMLEIATILSANIPHVRIDLYDINGKIYFGEMTFFHFSGIVPFEPEEWDYKIGEMLDLSMINKQNL